MNLNKLSKILRLATHAVMILKLSNDIITPKKRIRTINTPKRLRRE